MQLALAAELESEPGAKWADNNKAVNLLAGVVKRASGVPLDGGVWKGRRVLDEALARSAHDNAVAGYGYGLLWWLLEDVTLTVDDALVASWKRAGVAPALARKAATFLERKPFGYAAQGYLGQHLVVIPSERLVAVRMRRPEHGAEDDMDAGFIDFQAAVRALAPAGAARRAPAR